jgi:dTMP kinase
MNAPLFVTFEGIEGCGKSTQLARLAAHLRSLGVAVETTREPGGTRLGAALRSLLLDPSGDVGAEAELFLYLADRAENVRSVVEPALARGAVVLCDRHADATVAYQGIVRGLGADRTRDLNRLATRGRVPDLTFVFDLPVEEGLARARARGGAGAAADRLESESKDFHEGVRRAYLEIAGADPGRIRIVDARGTVDEVHERVVALLASLRPVA